MKRIKMRTVKMKIVKNEDGKDEKDKDEEWLVMGKNPDLKFQGGYGYNRSLVCDALKSRYGVENCKLLPSGMSAITTALHSIFWSCKYGSDDNKTKETKENNETKETKETKETATTTKSPRTVFLLYTSELFSMTPKAIEHMAKIYSGENFIIKTSRLHPTDDAGWKKWISNIECKDTHVILFFESCSNPNGYMVDPRWIQAFKTRTASATIIVDNTWLTSAIMNPFTFYLADYVVLSLTTYYSSAVLTRDGKKMDKVFEWIILNGLHVSPLKYLPSLDERIRKASAITLSLLSRLEELMAARIEAKIDGNSILKLVTHPAIVSHPSYKILSALSESSFSSSTRLVPNVISFTLRVNVKRAKKIMNRFCNAKSEEKKLGKVKANARESKNNSDHGRNSKGENGYGKEVDDKMIGDGKELKEVKDEKSGDDKKIRDKKSGNGKEIEDNKSSDNKVRNSIEYKTSFGSAKSRFDPYPKQVSVNEEKTDEKETMCRLAVGYEDDIESLYKNFVAFLEETRTI